MRIALAISSAILAAASSGCGNGTTSSGPSGGPSGGGMVTTQVPNEGWVHVAEGTPITYVHNPPASGPHYPVWARYEEFTTPLARPYWVHNLEHGAVVFLYRPDASAATVTELRAAFRGLPPDPECGHPRSLMTPDPLLARPVAVVAANWTLESDGAVDPQAIRDFASAHRNHAPEDICDGGARP